MSGSTVSAPLASATTEKLPTNDMDRLIFYTEVIIANMPSLITDLSSPKYTFLSFSEKTRNEVKQKSSLLQSVSRTYNSVLSLSRQVEERQRLLEKCEVDLVTASPPRFMTRAESLEAMRRGETKESSASGPVMILDDADIAQLRAAEEENRRQTETFVELSTKANEMEDLFAKSRVRCEEMTKHVQSLKIKYDALVNSLKATQRERNMLATQRDEHEQRQAIVQDAMDALQAMETRCRDEELEIIQSSIKKVTDDVDKVRAELRDRKAKHEVELAAYQIAYKEAQAETETLKDDIAFLKAHQKELEALAKQQQAEESRQNSLKRLVIQTLTWSASKDSSGERPLTSEQREELSQDHALVSVLAAKVAVMNEQRNDVAGIVAHVGNAFETDAVRSAMTRIQEVLGPAIELDEDALNRE